MGAIASGDVVVLNEHVLAQTGITDEALGEVAERERLELERREHLYRGDRPLPEITGRTIILIDDGLATGASVRAAVAALRRQQPGRLIVAVPVAAASTCDLLRPEVDELICLAVPNPFYGVGAWYADFSQTTDDQVRTLLEHARSFAGAHGHE